MKKHILLLILVLTFALGVRGQSTWGIKGGMNLSKLHLSTPEGSISTDNIFSLQMTGYWSGMLSEGLYLQPGVSIQGKGGKNKYIDSENKKVDNTTNLVYLEIPVNLVYYLNAGEGDIYVGLGPYAGWGVFGREKGEEGKQDVTWDSDEGYKRFDYGANFIIGYKFLNGMLVNGGYGLGLGNMMPKNDHDMKQYNRTFSLSVGYEF